MQFNLVRLFAAVTILAATFALSRWIGSVMVAMMIGLPIAAIALIAKEEHGRSSVRAIVSCAMGAGVVSILFGGGGVLGRRYPDQELLRLIFGALLVWFVVGMIDHVKRETTL